MPSNLVCRFWWASFHPPSEPERYLRGLNDARAPRRAMAGAISGIGLRRNLYDRRRLGASAWGKTQLGRALVQAAFSSFPVF